MNILYQELVERILGETSDMECVVQRALRAWSQAQKESEEQDIYLDAVALNLHSFYSGIERLFDWMSSGDLDTLCVTYIRLI
jgi:hypothetical protein